MYKYGRRNVSWSTVAPTGSVSILTQTTSGLEPLFAAYYMRRKKINPGEEGVRIDFIDQNGDSWMEYPILHPKLKYWIELQNNKSSEDEFLQRYNVLNKQDVDDAFKKSPWYGSTANDISWISRILTQEIIQKYTTHSISSTINLPNHVTKQEVSDIYMSAFKHNLKGVTVYRDGSRTGVLITDGSEDLSEFKYNNAVKRPKSLICKVHQSTYKGEDWLIAVGILHDKPYEVFCVKNTWVLPKGILEADITKVNRGNYKLEIKDVLTIESLALDMTAEQEAITRLISISLRHRADIKYVVEQLNKTDGDMQAFNKVLARNIKKYIPDGDKTTGVTCDNCGADAIIYEEGCQKCKSCGTSKC
jgi:ribonucleoside-diphosphate reductase alpha chain